MVAFSIIGTIVWIICLIANIKLAIKKNRSVAAWVVLSIFFSWIALIILAILKPLPSKEEVDQLKREVDQLKANQNQ
ncbi:hypothetical protein [Eubacterium oxidoreducens]|uniref:Phospholipase_D-nuclease N-terminal n=1 Tax=Eubacterium oxidoreducens TaxID=1732 RepID=A0A1G6BGY7_EUBOX|nr:hypothetical protein [Eubacterium oxidoreducens]SDB19859.1 hypothetical protein SAMN02910417_01500 [Eubacterium oxidoreducens]